VRRGTNLTLRPLLSGGGMGTISSPPQPPVTLPFGITARYHGDMPRPGVRPATYGLDSEVEGRARKSFQRHGRRAIARVGEPRRQTRPKLVHTHRKNLGVFMGRPANAASHGLSLIHRRLPSPVQHLQILLGLRVDGHVLRGGVRTGFGDYGDVIGVVRVAGHVGPV
jgi:hypothetical protein